MSIRQALSLIIGREVSEEEGLSSPKIFKELAMSGSPICGHEVQPDAKLCGECGRRQADD